MQLLRLCPLQNVGLQMLEYGHARVNLVVWSQYYASGDVVADFSPVEVVPEALGEPVEAHLWLEMDQSVKWLTRSCLFSLVRMNKQSKIL